MSKASPYFKNLNRDLIFVTIEQKVSEFIESDPEIKEVLNFGVGDVAFPIKPHIQQALHDAIDDVGTHVRGYGPSTGQAFLKKAIIDSEYGKYGIKPSEIFISDGIMSDASSIIHLFDESTRIAIPDPTYPVYLDACVLSGRTSSLKKGYYPEIVYLPCDESTNFVPKPPKKKCDLVFLCSPNNPTGCALTKEELEVWIEYAHKHDAIIVLDAAYEAFIHTENTPKSIYEIPNARNVAIELRSFSKTAGFSGLRLSYAVIPDKVKVSAGKEHVSLNKYWTTRQNVTFNGPSYIIQKAGAASLTKQGKEETQNDIKIYLECGTRLKQAISDQGFECFGGLNSPYLWWKCPESMTSWDFFDYLLHKHGMVTIPGCGFGPRGKGFIRMSSFTTEEKTEKAIERIKQIKI